MKEAPWQAQVIELAVRYGWWWWHAPDNRPAGRGRARHVQRTVPGFPDLVLIRGPELLFVELKGTSTRVTDAQHAVISMLAVVEAWNPHVEVHVWRPDDWDRALARLSRPMVEA